MSNIDLSDLGREIGEKVKKFIDSEEIKDLQDNIRATVETTFEEVRKSTKDAADHVNKNRKTYGRRQLPVVKRPKGGLSGTLMEVFGTCGAVIGWTAALMGYAFSLMSVDVFGNLGVLAGLGILSTGVITVLACICTGIAITGSILRRRAKRFKCYVKTLGNKDFYSIEGLAKAVEKKEKFVISDLKKMIRKGWFREGHLDEQETCFMLTNESYQLYLDAQEQLMRRKEEEERIKKEQELMEQDPVRKQLKLAVEEGEEYIRRIRQVNDEIPGEEISAKLYRLENVCRRIFEHVEANPEKLADIRKFMSYYLPTTLKLVEAYYEFSAQPVQGEHITTSKLEIEGMLDSINKAFEKMFDDLYEDDAMDISTDISVLSAMLAQEGLLEDDFKVK